MKVIFVIFTFIFIFAGCSDFKGSSAGKLGEKCFGNGTCKSDLICVDNVCVESIVGGNDDDDLSDEVLTESEDTEPDENTDNEIPDEEEDDEDVTLHDKDISVDNDEESDEETDTENDVLPDDDVPNQRDVECVNTLPENASWDPANPDGWVTQTWTGTKWIPDEESCIWDCNPCYDLVETFCVFTILGGGVGTAGDPFTVSTPRHLDQVRCFAGLNYFRQTSDIDLSGYTTGEGWDPIGQITSRFSGHYDGQGFKITNLFINRPTANNQGLFGYVLNGSLNNIKIENVDVTGGTSIGALAGIIEGTQVVNCYSRYGIESEPVNIKGESNAGGLIGYNFEGSTIENSHSFLGVDGNESVGGLTGMSFKSNISKSYATGSVMGNKFVGGLVGYLMGTTTQKAKIENCYSRGDIKRKSGTNAYTASFAGIVNYGEINHCFCTGIVVFNDSTNPVDKGFSGGITGPSTFSGNFFDNETTLQTTGINATGLTTSQMKSSAFFSGEGWDFSVTWGSDGTTNEGYMYLK